MIPEMQETDDYLDEYVSICVKRYGVPDDIVYSLYRYVNGRIPEGGFMTAVLSNDLRESFARADHINKHKLFNIVDFCYNEIPALCWGSPEKVNNWLKRKDENG